MLEDIDPGHTINQIHLLAAFLELEIGDCVSKKKQSILDSHAPIRRGPKTFSWVKKNKNPIWGFSRSRTRSKQNGTEMMLSKIKKVGWGNRINFKQSFGKF